MSVHAIDHALPAADLPARGGRRRMPLTRRLRRIRRLLVSAVRALVAARMRHSMRSQAMSELHAVDDRALADLGLTRGEIAFVLRQTIR